MYFYEQLKIQPWNKHFLDISFDKEFASKNFFIKK